MQDSESNAFGLDALKREKESFESYQRELLGQPKIEPSIEDLDKQKAIMETVDGKATSLLKGMTQEQTRNQKQIDNETPEYDD